MANTHRDFAAQVAECRLRTGPVIDEFETIIKHALRNDSDFDASSPDIVRVQLKAKGEMQLVTGSGIPHGRSTPQLAGAWTPDRLLLAELLSRTLENRSRRWLSDECRYVPMPDEWPEVLRKRWPDHFDCELSIGTGWVDLLLAVHTWLLELGGDFRWSQIKEKFGGARFYFDGNVGAVGNEITMIAEESLSFCICEVCGGPGRLASKRGWYLTRCAEHLAAAR